MKTDIFLLLDDMLESIKDMKKMVINIKKEERNR